MTHINTIISVRELILKFVIRSILSVYFNVTNFCRAFFSPTINKIKFARNPIFPDVLAIISFNVLPTIYTRACNECIYSMRNECVRRKTHRSGAKCNAASMRRSFFIFSHAMSRFK